MTLGMLLLLLLQRWQPTRLSHPWDSPGKNTGVGCHFLLQCMKVKNESDSPTVADCLQHPDACGPSTPAGQQTKPTANQSADAVSASDVLRLIGATAFVLVLLYALLKWLSRRHSPAFGSKGLIENLGGTSVGANRSVQLIKVGNRLLVIGVGDSIQLLREISNEDEINELLAQHNERLERMASFHPFGSRLREYWTAKAKRGKRSGSVLFLTVCRGNEPNGQQAE